MNKDYINTNDNDRDNLNTENIFEEFYLPFTEAEVEKMFRNIKEKQNSWFRQYYERIHFDW